MSISAKEKTAKNKIKIGSLVKITTYANVDNFSYTTTHWPLTKTLVSPRSSGTHTGYALNNKTNYTSSYSNNTDCQTGFSANQIDNLYNALSKYYNSKVEKNFNSSKLGMSHMSSNKKNKQINQANSNNSVTIPIGTFVSNNTTSTGSTVGSVKYFATCFPSLKDYALRNTKQIEQVEHFNPEELKRMANTAESVHSVLCFGKPFLGIIVDAYYPNKKSENGEQIPEINGTTELSALYKVLIGENECYWFLEDDVCKIEDKEVDNGAA